MNKNKQFGGVALEYLVVTIFAALMSFLILSLASDFIENKLTEFSSQLNIKLDMKDFDLFKLIK